jgi:hypothetical protein
MSCVISVRWLIPRSNGTPAHLAIRLRSAQTANRQPPIGLSF